MMTRPRRAITARFIVSAFAAVVTMAALADTVATQRPHFYPDDPLAREPESQDASKAQPYGRPDMYEMLYNLFVTAGHKPSGARARNVNTIDEVADSSWFTNRIGATPVTAEALARGPVVGAPPDPSKWVLIREKTAGVHPGFTKSFLDISENKTAARYEVAAFPATTILTPSQICVLCVVTFFVISVV